MSRRRYLSTDAGKDKVLRDVARQSMFASTFYLMAIPCAGDDCALPTNDPDELLWEVWPAMARDYTAEDVEAAIELLVGAGLWEYAPSGRLRYPPKPYYKHQSYIGAGRRGEGGEEQRTAPVTAQVVQPGEPSAQISANQRKSAQNTASSSVSVSSSVLIPPPSEGTAPVADAPDAPPPVELVKTIKARALSEAKPNRYGLVIDAIRAEQVDYAPNDIDAKAANNLRCGLQPEQIAEVYAAIARRTFGQEYHWTSLSVPFAIRCWNAYLADKQAPAKQSGPPKSAEGRHLAQLQREGQIDDRYQWIGDPRDADTGTSGSGAAAASHIGAGVARRFPEVRHGVPGLLRG